jgi:hypothetical protein
VTLPLLSPAVSLQIEEPRALAVDEIYPPSTVEDMEESDIERLKAAQRYVFATVRLPRS